MKKVYLVLAAAMVGGASYGQVNFGPFKASSLVDARNTPQETRIHNVNTNTPSANRAVVWSDDFTNTANWALSTGAGHTPVGSSNPGWEFVTALPSSLTGQGSYTTLASTSGGNFAFIDSDAPGGSATQDATITWNGTAIDLSSAGTNFLSLEWQQIHRMFYDIHTLKVSVDGGSTFTDYEVNTIYGADVNNYLGHQSIPNPQTVNLPLGGLFDPFVTGGGTLNNVVIAFNYVGAWDWYWAIDDINFITTPDHEMNQLHGRHASATLDPVWGDLIPYNTIASGQINPAGYVFFNEAVNEGSQTQATGSLLATVMDGTTTVFTGTGLGYSNIAPIDTLRDTTTTTFVPNSTNYVLYDVDVDVTYTNLASDDNTANNSEASTMEVTQYIHGRAPLGYSSSGSWNGAGNAYIMGPEIVAYANQTVYAVRVALHPNTDAGAVIYPYIVEMDPMAADFQSLFVNVLYDGTQVAGGEYTVQASDIASSTTMKYVDLILQTPITLTAGSAYVIGVGSLGGDDVVLMAGAPYAPSATNFVYDAVGANNGSIQWFWLSSTTKVYANFDPNVGVKELAENNTMSLQNFPNPAENVTTISYALNQSADQVNVQIVDVTGKVVMNINQGARNAGTYNFDLNVADFANGTYFYTLQAGAEKVTKRLVVAK